MKLVFITQELDPEHPALAQSIDLVDALASRVDELAIVTRRVRCRIPENAVARTFDGRTRLSRGFAFEHALASSIGGAAAVLVHMVPDFAVLAAPIVKLRRVPLLLWYTHWHAGRALRVATGLASAVLSVDRSSFPLETPKLHPIGHAIDVGRFAGGPPEPHDGPLRLLALGRTARWKGLLTLVDAIALTRTDVRLEIRGPSLTDDERAHRVELEQRIRELPVELLPQVPRRDVPGILAAADAIMSPNEPHRGATLDKVVFEAAACARPTISTNRAFAALLDGAGLQLIVPPRDPAALAAAIDLLVEAGPAARAAAGAVLRQRVVERHSLDHWASAVVRVVDGLGLRRERDSPEA